MSCWEGTCAHFRNAAKQHHFNVEPDLHELLLCRVYCRRMRQRAGLIRHARQRLRRR